MSPVQGKSSLVQVKESYCNLDMVLVGFHPATRSVQCNLLIMLESEHQAVYRERKAVLF